MFQFFSRRLHGERGFTLIELLIVVAIIAILAAILIPNFLRARAQSQVSATKGNEKNLATALESYFVDNNVYPTTLSQLVANYLRAVPNDPCTVVAYTYTAGTGNTSYTLQTPSWVGTQCANIQNGVSYSPGGGIVNY